MNLVNSRKWKLLIALLIAVVGGWLALHAFGQLRHQSSYQSWPSVAGVIVYSEVDNDESNMPVIVYQFSVGDRPIIDTTNMGAPGFGNKRKRWEYAREILSAYPEGREVTVHYNPIDPNDSAIRTSVNFEVYTQLSFGVFLIFGGLLWLVAITLRKSTAEK